MSAYRAPGPPPAIAMVGIGAVSVQFGAAVATKLFSRVGPGGAVTLRLGLAALVLWLIALSRRSSMTSVPRDHLAVACLFGLVLGGMNLSFYEAIARIPLGVAVTVEFSGPLVLALAGSRRLVDALWAVLAGGGVALLASGAGHGLNAAGLGLAFLAGACWIGYILLSKETGKRLDARLGLAVAMTTGAIAVVPVGLVNGGSRLFHPTVLLLGTTVAVLSSVVPYSLELLALRRVTARAFGVMLSLDPAVATAAGWIVLGQHLSGREWAALGLVVAANLGNSLAGRPDVVTTAP